MTQFSAGSPRLTPNHRESAPSNQRSGRLGPHLADGPTSQVFVDGSGRRTRAIRGGGVVVAASILYVATIPTGFAQPTEARCPPSLMQTTV
jgi:hypothetical protein